MQLPEQGQNSYVDPTGRIYLPYLSTWSRSVRCLLAGLDLLPIERDVTMLDTA